MAQTGKIYSSYISNILNNLQGEVSFTVEDDTAPIFDTLFSQNAFSSIPEGSTISKIEIKFQSKINQTASRYEAQWSIYDVGYPLDWDGNYTGYTNLPKYQSTWTSSSKMNLLTNTYQPFTCTINNPSLDAIRTGLMVRTRVTYEDAQLFGTNSSTVYIKDFHVIAYYTPPTYYLDIQGRLDGGDENGNLSDWGTAEVYIGGNVIKDDNQSTRLTDYYTFHDYGTTYEVKNIVANSGYKYVGNSSYSGTLTSNTTIVLPFETKTACTITYNGNSATSGSVAAQSGYVGDSLTLRDNGFVKKCNVTYYSNENPNITDDSLDELQTSVSSATFLGWYTAAEGGTRVGGSGDSYTPSGDTTLYAHWSAAVTTPTPTRDGYTLLGWYTERSGGTKVADGGGSYTPSGSILLYAHWKVNSTNMIYVGTKQPTFYIGTKQVQSIYLGMSLIYEVVLPKISYDSIKTFGNLLVPSGETSKTYTLPAANLENAEGNISYALYSDDECTTSVGTGITFDENTRQVTISNAAKDTVATQDTDKDGLAKFYIKATYESLSAVGEITLENYKVTATFNYLNKEESAYVDKITEVYYGTSAEEFAGTINDFSSPKNDEHCHHIKNGWVDFYGETEIDRVIKDTTFVLSYTQEPHEIDPTIAGYEIKEPTCTEAGYTKGYCGYCAKQENGYKGLIQVEIPATGHKDTNGDDICDVCGESIVQIVDSGTCGNNLTYTLDSNGVLTISGTGDMQNSSFGWDKDLIKSVVINDGVTSIGDRALQYCTSLTNIIIGNNVTSIGKYAFDGCTGLTSITIPNSVTSINANAFEDCTGLTKITVSSGNTVYHSTDNCLIETENKTLISGCKNSIIPTDGSVTSIGNYAFDGCTGLTSITIPNSVTSIGTYAFYRCTGLTSINVSSGNTVYHSTDNCLIETENKTLISGCKNSIIPTDGSVTNIGKYAFRGCTGLTSITIPDSVTSIEPYAFYGCTGLTSVTIGNSVTSIGDRAFEECTGLTSITIGNSVTSIGVRAFDSCTNLTSITIPDSVTSIGNYAFSSCTGLTSVTIGNSVTSIGDFVFYRCYGITRIIIPDSVTSIGNSAFSYCKNLTEVDFSTCTDIPTLESSNVFSNTSSNLAIKVPSALVDEWKAATNWSTYADKIMGVRL